MTYWCRQSSFDRPADINAALQRVRLNSQFFGPSCNTLSSPIKRQQSIIATIASLFSLRGPYAIAWFIVAVVIFSINGMLSGWLVAHIIIEGFKRIPPLFTNGDSATAIQAVSGAISVVATPNNMRPRFIFSSVAFTVGLTSSNGDLFLETAATSRSSICQTATTNNGLSTAVAAAEPKHVGSISLAFRSFKHSPTTKDQPRQIFHARRSSNRMRISHDDSSNIRLVRTARQLQLLGRSHFYRNYLVASSQD